MTKRDPRVELQQALGRGRARGNPLPLLELPRPAHHRQVDLRPAALDAIVAEGAPVEAIWRRRAFCRLGDGDVDVDGVLDALRDVGYTGWLVVEQDIIPDPSDPADQADQEQRANREFLRVRGL